MSARYWRSTSGGVIVAVAGVAVLTTGLSQSTRSIGLLNEGLIFLLLTLAVTATSGPRAGIFAALLSNLCLNYFFIEPLHRFSVHDGWNIIGLAVFLAVSLVASSLLAQAREAAALARRRQRVTEVTLGLSRAMVGQTEPESALQALCSQALLAFEARGCALLGTYEDGWHVVATAGEPDSGRPPSSDERLMAERALSDRRVQAAGSLPGGKRPRRIVARQQASIRRYMAMIPIDDGQHRRSVLRLDLTERLAPGDNLEELLTAFTREAAIALQRVELARVAGRTEILRQADAMKTALMASISHDLKTPLAAIKTSVSSLLDAGVDWPESDRRAFLETIEAQADRLDRVISDVLDLTRIESGAVVPILRPVLALDLVEEASERMADRLGDHAVSIEVEEGLAVMTDESLVIQALVNLIDNAARYSRPGGPIRVTGRGEGSDAVLSVADEGPGIDTADLPHVFERFYRGSRPSADRRGSGLGLPIARAFVDLAGGSVDVESSEAGTRFSLKLPRTTRVAVPA